jgi:hypothetical protein
MRTEAVEGPIPETEPVVTAADTAAGVPEARAPRPSETAVTTETDMQTPRDPRAGA